MISRPLRVVLTTLIVGMLAACSTPPPPAPQRPSAGTPAPTAPVPGDTGPLPPPLAQGKSRWVPVHWSELPGFDSDALHEAWNAWIKGCERPAPAFAPLCAEVRRLSIASAEEQRAWMVARLQPYRIEAFDGRADGLLTGYYEPLMDAARLPGNGFNVPLYRLPASFERKPWYTRQQIETLPEAQAALAGRAIAWLRDPVDALVLHIQGSGRLRVTEPDGSQRLVRLAFAGTNDHPYQSVGRWLLDQGATRDATWPGIKAWIAANPQRVNELLWSNPRYVFFREEPQGSAGRGADPRALHRRRPAEHSLRHPGMAGLQRPPGAAGAPGDGPGHGQRHRGRGAGGLFHRLGPRGGRRGRATETGAAPVGVVAAVVLLIWKLLALDLCCFQCKLMLKCP